jgi:hypothetical protein
MVARVEYAKQAGEEGRWVIPIHWPLLRSPALATCSCGDPECDNIGKHPLTPNGFKDATNDLKAIDQFWKKWPFANIAVRTGIEFNLIVLDFDSPDALMEAEEKLGHRIDGVRVKTGRGVHIYVRPGDDLKSLKSSIAVLPGFDVRADGAYVISYGSLHANGEFYERLGDTKNLPVIQDSVLKLISTKPKSEVEVIDDSKIPAGKRNDFLCKLAGSLRRHGVNEKDLYNILWTQNIKRCVPPESESRVRAIAKGAKSWKAEANYNNEPSHNDGEIPVEPMSLTDLMARPAKPINWIWEGRIASTGASVVAGKPKAGKSTLIRDLCYSIGLGAEFFGFKTRKCRVLYITYEDNFDYVFRPQFLKKVKKENDNFFIISPDQNYNASIPNLTKLIHEYGFELIVIDPLTHAFKGDINNLKESYAFLKAYHDLGGRLNCHIMFVHHARKGVGLEAIDSASGSNGLIGAVDNGFFLSIDQDEFRSFEAHQRIGQGLSKHYIEQLENGEYKLHENIEKIKRQKVEEQLLKLLSESKYPLNEKEIRYQLHKGDSRTKSAVLRYLYDMKKIDRCGAGGAKDPFRYFIPKDTLSFFQTSEEKS